MVYDLFSDLEGFYADGMQYFNVIFMVIIIAITIKAISGVAPKVRLPRLWK